MLLGGTLLLAGGWGWRVLTREKGSIQRDPGSGSGCRAHRLPASLRCRDPQRGSPERGTQEKASFIHGTQSRLLPCRPPRGSQKVKRVGTQWHMHDLMHSLRRDLCQLPSPTEPGTPLWNASLTPPSLPPPPRIRTLTHTGGQPPSLQTWN